MNMCQHSSGAPGLSLTTLAGGAQARTVGPAIASCDAGVICPSSGNDVPLLPFVTQTLVVPAVHGMLFGAR